MKIIKEISTAQNRLVYRLTTTDVESIATYGIIVSTTLFGNEETEYVEHITTDIDFGLKLLNILADNTVLPSTLKEIITDFVAEYYTVSC